MTNYKSASIEWHAPQEPEKKIYRNAFDEAEIQNAKGQLSEYGEELQEEFEAAHGDSCCSCHINPPCSYCTHPGNPICLENTPEAWVIQDIDSEAAQIDEAAWNKLTKKIRQTNQILHNKGLGGIDTAIPEPPPGMNKKVKDWLDTNLVFEESMQKRDLDGMKKPQVLYKPPPAPEPEQKIPLIIIFPDPDAEASAIPTVNQMNGKVK